MITSLLYASFASDDVDQTRRAFRDLFALPSEQVDPDPVLGADKAARIPFSNGCWLYIVGSQQSGSRVTQLLQQRGPGLEGLAFRSDDIEAEFQRVRDGGVPLKDADLLSTPSGRRFTIPREHFFDMAVDVIETADDRWKVPDRLDSPIVLGLQHPGIAVNDLEAASGALQRLFDLHPAPMVHPGHLSFLPGNEFHWMDVAEGKKNGTDRLSTFLKEKGEGIEHLCFEVADIREAVWRIKVARAAFDENKIYTDRPNGLEAFVFPQYTTGTTIELIEPYPNSPGYRSKKV